MVTQEEIRDSIMSPVMAASIMLLKRYKLYPHGNYYTPLADLVKFALYQTKYNSEYHQLYQSGDPANILILAHLLINEKENDNTK